MNTETLYFYPKMTEIQRLKVRYPHIEILQLSCKINCYKVELVHNHQLLIVLEDISVKVRCIFWGKFNSQLLLLSWLIQERVRFCELDTFMNIARMQLQHYFMVRVANFEPSYLSHFWIKTLSLCAHWTGNFLNFLKLPQLLSLDPFQGLLWAFYEESPFFWDTLQ